MDSYALHYTVQRFPTAVLRLELERELDRVLLSQVRALDGFFFFCECSGMCILHCVFVCVCVCFCVLTRICSLIFLALVSSVSVVVML